MPRGIVWNVSLTWEEKVANIKTNNKTNISGLRSYAPNKPLLLLYLMSKLLANKKSNVRWSQVEKDLGAVLINYGRKQNVIDPFFRLRRDGLFVVEAIDSSSFTDPQNKGFQKFLNQENPEGRLPKEFEEYLLIEDNMRRIIGIILNKYFPYSIYDLILSDVNLPNNYIPPTESSLDKKRSAKFIKEVINTYSGRCVFCDFNGEINGKAIGVDAAHIVQHSRGGEDSIENGLSLCTLCHRLFDRGVITLNDEFKVLISPKYKGRIAIKINEPIVKGGAKMLQNLRWHREEVFNA
jgi:putative restriction endonuclease